MRSYFKKKGFSQYHRQMPRYNALAPAANIMPATIITPRTVAQEIMLVNNNAAIIPIITPISVILFIYFMRLILSHYYTLIIQ
jgi:hypothetical protein